MLEEMGLIGLVVMVTVWVIKRLGWGDGVRSLWLAMVVSLVFGVVASLLSKDFVQLPTCAFVGDPVDVVGCVSAWISVLAQNAGIAFVASQVIYQAIRRALVPAAERLVKK